MKSPINILLQNFPIVSANKGCEALSYSIIYLIDKIMTKHNLTYNIYSSYRLNKCNTSVSLPEKKINYQVIYLPKIRSVRSILSFVKNFSYNINLFKKLKKINVSFEIGEGDSFSDIYGSKRFNQINNAHKLARRLKIPHYLLPQTIGPFKNPKIASLAIESMKNADGVMTRDSQSSDYVKNLINKEPDEFIDIAFVLPYKKINFDNKKIHVGVNVSGLLWNGGYTKNNQFDLKVDYQDSVIGLIRSLLSIENVQIHLISHVFDLNNDSVENDFAVMSKIYKELNNEKIILAPLFFDPIEAKSYISGMDFFIGSRMHATIAAFSSGVPVVPWAYSRKFNGLYIDTLNYDNIIDLQTTDTEEAIKETMSLLEKKEEIKNQIKKANEDIVNPKILNLEHHLSNILLNIVK